jgi:hypothetical protein
VNFREEVTSRDVDGGTCVITGFKVSVFTKEYQGDEINEKCNIENIGRRV